MDTNAKRYLAYNDVRGAQSAGEKAILRVHKYGLSQKCASRVLKVDRGVIRRALIAQAEGRQIGCNGRPKSLSVGESAEVIQCVEKMIEEHRSPTKWGVAFFCLSTSYLTISNQR